VKSQAETLHEIRQYLLGTLSQGQVAEFEERLLSDGEIYEELLIVEDELVDQFLSGELSATERERVESHFLSTPQRREQLRFAQLLRRYVSDHTPQTAGDATSEPSAVAVVAKRRSFLSRVLPQNHALAFSMIVVLLLLVVGGFWLANVIRRRASEPQTVWAVELTPGLTRDEGETHKFAVPTNTDTVRLQLDLTEDQYQSYEAILQDADGRPLTTGKNLKAQSADGRTAVFLDVRRDLMPPGDYRAKLSGRSLKGEAESVASYSFRVLKN